MQKIKINRFHTVKSLGVDRDIVNKMTLVTQRRAEIENKVHEKERNRGFEGTDHFTNSRVDKVTQNSFAGIYITG